MSKVIKNTASYFLFLILLSSCYNDYNDQKSKAISSLEKTTMQDYNKLKSLKNNDIESILKIAKLNLLEIEKKEFDSVAIELIYFEYRDYLNCINTIYESLKKIDNLNDIITNNSNQLQNMKDDYNNSRSKRDDLEKYLLEEIEIVKETSRSVNDVTKKIKQETIRFNNLNKQIEEFIN